MQQAQVTSPSKMLSLRGILLARTHFDVLGFVTGAQGVRDITDADVRAAYRRMALRCHPDRCADLGAPTAFVRVGQAFASLKTCAGREEAWQQVCSGRGYLPLTTIPGAENFAASTPLEQSAAVLRAEGEALVVELRRWKEEWAEGVYATSVAPSAASAAAHHGGRVGWGVPPGGGGSSVGGGGGGGRGLAGLPPAAAGGALGGEAKHRTLSPLEQRVAFEGAARTLYY
mmetsp:Transcript_40557/g.100239  ORF Transcript_40557/g.100239 Transcript_40557/m.100239 type:complete len:229 (+) Transcript_40557:131-817(+)|eukprot:CAMPEP_0197598482 /NCGR_PEP_ID=MMETSP1326-20131121/29407_1 /TAXON_ID=1155430 /ORGANISM="Genus nov. species nov., Strain RCC2288" /LENGTH=228 /DNA_ID=CAMNT_0043165293 /DNA_START=102 /DNA_END=788 /DNA_ORIENTATION=+